MTLLATEMPHNEEAEQGVLAAILSNRHALDEVADRLRPEDFYIPANGRIYAAALALRAAGMSVNPVTLRRRFERDGDLASVGGAQYLGDLASSIVMVADVGDYARVVRSTAIRRALIDAAGEIIAEAARPEDEDDIGALIAEAEQQLFRVAQSIGAASTRLAPLSAAIGEMEEAVAAALEPERHRTKAPSTGLPDLDDVIGGLVPGRVIVVAGRPGMGKSCLAINIAENAARRGAPVLFCSLEMSRAEVLARMAARQTGIPTDRQAGGPPAMTRREASQVLLAAHECAALPILVDDGGLQTIASVTGSARRLRRQRGIGLVVIDYLQLLAADRRRQDNRVQELTEMTRDTKVMARELGVCVLLLSQLSRQVEGRDDKRPHLSDLRDSGSIEQDADQVVFPYRHEYYLRPPERREGEAADKFMARQTSYEEALADARGRADLIVAKNRHGRQNTAVRVEFDGVRQRFQCLLRAGRGGGPSGLFDDEISYQAGAG